MAELEEAIWSILLFDEWMDTNFVEFGACREGRCPHGEDCYMAERWRDDVLTSHDMDTVEDARLAVGLAHQFRKSTSTEHPDWPVALAATVRIARRKIAELARVNAHVASLGGQQGPVQR